MFYGLMSRWTMGCVSERVAGAAASGAQASRGSWDACNTVAAGVVASDGTGG
jgi:hypothetical protein